ncbi:MAG: hypothetical protein ACE5FI_09045, partial [Anaerolineales bacterium]
MPALRAPRNFTLRPEDVGTPARPPTRFVPALRWATTLAAIAFAVVLVGDVVFTFGMGAARPAAEPLAFEAADAAVAEPEEEQALQELAPAPTAAELAEAPAAAVPAEETPILEPQLAAEAVEAVEPPPAAAGLAAGEDAAQEPDAAAGEVRAAETVTAVQSVAPTNAPPPQPTITVLPTATRVIPTPIPQQTPRIVPTGLRPTIRLLELCLGALFVVLLAATLILRKRRRP